MIRVLTAAPARLMAVLTSVSVQMVSPDHNVRSRLAHLIPARMMVSVRSSTDRSSASVPRDFPVHSAKPPRALLNRV